MVNITTQNTQKLTILIRKFPPHTPHPRRLWRLDPLEKFVNFHPVDIIIPRWWSNGLYIYRSLNGSNYLVSRWKINLKIGYVTKSLTAIPSGCLHNMVVWMHFYCRPILFYFKAELFGLTITFCSLFHIDCTPFLPLHIVKPAVN